MYQSKVQNEKVKWSWIVIVILTTYNIWCMGLPSKLLWTTLRFYIKFQEILHIGISSHSTVPKKHHLIWMVFHGTLTREYILYIGLPGKLNKWPRIPKSYIVIKQQSRAVLNYTSQSQGRKRTDFTDTFSDISGTELREIFLLVNPFLLSVINTRPFWYPGLCWPALFHWTYNSLNSASD